MILASVSAPISAPISASVLASVLASSSVSSLTVAAAVWICLSFAIGSFAQAVSGFGFALIAIPLSSLVVSPVNAVVIQTFAGALLSGYMAWQYRPDSQPHVLKVLLPGVVVGIAVGMLVSTRLNDRALRFAVGVTVIIAALAIATGFRIRTRHTKAIFVIAGLVSGVLGATTGTNGPPIVIAMAGQDTPPPAFRANLQVAFAIGNLVLVPAFIAAGRVTRVGIVGSIVAFVPTLVGRVFGERVFAALDPKRFRSVVLGMLFLAGTVALAKAVSG